MKRFITTLALGALILAAISGCSKKPHYSNPQEIPLSVAQPFEVIIEEVRGEKAFTWAYEDGTLDNHEESIKTLYATSLNKLTLKASASGGGSFNGVNVSSSDPVIVSVSRVSNSEYTLQYHNDGQATITVSSGSGTDIIKKTFTMQAKEYIDVEGLRFTYGGKPLVVKHTAILRPSVYCKEGDNYPDFSKRPKEGDITWHQYNKPNIWVEDPNNPGHGTFVIDVTRGALLRFEGLEPENTSFRTVIDFESEWDYCWDMTRSLCEFGYFDEGMYDNWPNETNVNKDVGEYVGREIWYADVSLTYVVCMKVKINDGKTKYLILYHGEG